MADKRISQLIERTDIANNDVLPIVASGATTTNKVTVSTLQDWMQENLDVGVTSVGLSMPSAFTVSNSPVTTSGNISVSGAGTVSQYIRGDGSLADFPSISGGGSSVSYYLNGSVSQGTIGGIGYYEMNKVPILGTGTDFVAIADGYLASFITDAGDPSLLEIPGGNWNFETYFSASSGGGTPSFYIELYKVNSGGTATLIASNSATPELIAFGTTITPYFSTLAVPTTTLALTDRLALRYYVARSGRTITLHTENSHLCQIITTFTTGLTALNGLTAQVQNLATGTSGSDFNIVSSGTTHTFNIPSASADNRGLVTTGAQNFAGNKSFQNTIFVNAGLRLDQNGTALPTFVQNISGTGLISSGSNGLGFNSGNNLYFSGSDKGGAVFSVNNSAVRTYTLQNANGTLAFTSDLGGYLPLTGGTLTGPLFGTSAQFSGDIQSGTRLIASATSQSIILTPNSGGTTNRIEGVGTLPLALVSGAAITMAAGGTTPQITLATTGAATFSNTLAVTGQAAFGTSVNTTHDVLIQGTTSNNTKNAFRIQNSSAASLFAVRNDGVIDLYNNTTVGGTLSVTGALNGTSASFTAAGSTFVSATTTGGSDMRISSGATNGFVGTTSNHPLSFVVNNSVVATIAVGGAVTFSSSVNAGQLFLATPSNLVGNINSSATNGGYLTWQTAGTTIADIGTATQIFGSGGAEVFGINARGARSLSFGTNNTARFTLASTGAATFSSSVTSVGLRSIDAANTWSFSTGSNASTPNIVALGTISGTPSIQGFNFGFSTNQNLCLQPQSGNVGIGTTSPQDRLDVNGSIRFKGNTPSFTAATDNAVIDYVPTSVFATAPQIRMAAIGTASVGASINFLTGTSTSLDTRMSITSDAYVRLSSNAGGIQFNGDTAAANALDDYEEGSFTPSSVNTSFSSVTAVFGRYIKIGNQVTINVRWDVTLSSTGMKFVVFNLPFAFVNDNNVQFTGVVCNYNGGLSSSSSNVGTTVRNSSGSTTQQYVEAYYTSTNNNSLLLSMTYFTFF